MVVDTSAIMAILLDEEGAERLGEVLAATTGAVMSAASYVELRIVALARGIAGRTEVDETLADATIDIVPVTPNQARLAASAFERFGKGRGHPAQLNYGDCFAYALAKERGEPLLFKGLDFASTDLESAA